MKVIFQTTVGEKNIKKTNILLFSADIHTYKLTFVSFFYVFFCTFPLDHDNDYDGNEYYDNDGDYDLMRS